MAEVASSPPPKNIILLIGDGMGFESVRWRESIDFLFAEHDDLSFVEVGPRQALTNLLSPR
ncbi:MAG: hypothetical protein KC800_32095, partial [Candidatus Eremiobacteraeota bacterium]|nr:hypothetical protein [Candidatus Eremiobacteraeota bacterium]